MVSRTLVVSLALSLLLPILLHAGDVQTPHDKDLDGKWEGASFIIEGEEVTESFMILLVEKDKVTVTEGTRITILFDGGEHQVVDADTVRGAIKLSLKSSPKTINFTWLDGLTKGEMAKGIYDIKGDVMRLCISPPEKDRPTEFSSKKGDDRMMGTLKRVKK